MGACVYYFDANVGHKLSLLQPHFVVVGSGCWNDIDAIAAACPPDCTFILRNMADNLIDWNVADVVNGMLEVAHKHPTLNVVAHALNERYNDVPKALQWELSFIERCHDNGLKTICLNGAYGNDPDPRYKAVAGASDYIGWHLYDGCDEDKQAYVDRIHTSRRYAANWLVDYAHKYIATEVGIESFPGTGQRRGWHDMGLSEVAVKDRMMANAMEWYADGLLGACWFTAGHTEQSWSEGYGMTDLMARAWAKLPAPRENEMAITKQDLEAARLKIREQFLNVQRALGATIAGNVELAQRKAADQSLAAFNDSGLGVNVTDAEFAELAKKL